MSFSFLFLSYVYILGLPVWCFYGIPEGVVSGSLFLVPPLGLFSSCLFCPIPIHWFLFYFIVFYYHPLEPCLFSNDTQKGWI